MNTQNNDQVVYLYLDDIIPNRFQPREVFDEKALKELAISIKEHGVIQPIIVRSVKGKYEIIAGERRYKASALAGLTKIPAIIRDLDDKESSKVALLENLQRKNLTPIEEARTYQKILEIDEMTQEELAKTMGKSQSAIANKLRLLSLPDEVQNALLKEQISERHARALLNIPNSQGQKDMLKKIVSGKLSVKTVEEEIKKLYQIEDKSEVDQNMNDSVTEISISNAIPSVNNYLNQSPLAPTSNSLVEQPEYGNIKIAPPIQELLPDSQKFINYGEIDKEEEEDIEPQMAFNNPTKLVDLDSIRNSATDINMPSKESGSPTADLDSLLNLQNIAIGPAAGSSPGENKFITPAEEIVKTDVPIPPKKVSADYFEKADYVPTIVPSPINQSVVSTSSASSAESSLEKIKDLVAQLKAQGVSIEYDEMNFTSAYQVIIKIDK